jgi:hypothetical protein
MPKDSNVTNFCVQMSHAFQFLVGVFFLQKKCLGYSRKYGTFFGTLIFVQVVVLTCSLLSLFLL